MPFTRGDFAESVRIATIIRVLVHESGMSKPLLTQAKPNGLELPILEHVGEWAGQEPIFGLCCKRENGTQSRTCRGSWLLTPHLEFHWCMVESHCFHVSVTAGHAVVDPNEDADYTRLLTDLPLSFADYGVPVETPDFARFLTAQSGVEMLDSLRRNFFPDQEVPSKWGVWCSSCP